MKKGSDLKDPSTQLWTGATALLTKKQLAYELAVSERQIEVLVRRRVIPVVRLGPRCVRFRLEAVMAALEKLEVKEVGR